MENNIDKDIEILKEVIYCLNETMDYEEPFKKEVSHIAIDKRELQALENVLSELESYKGKIILSDEEYNKVIDNAQKDIKSELETYKKIVDEKNKELNEENLRCSKLAVENNDLKEKLKTYKKIAEKLAEEYKKENVYYDNIGIIYCELHYENDYTKHGKCSKHNNGANCIQCIIDWARNEVENE